ncbi:integral membrane protein [Colletotrichum camelliae]|nr:integral membrane protein [Colletotrichum camelliae]
MAATMTGEQISAIAYQLEPLTPKGLGPAVEFIAIVFGIVCVIVVGLRIYVRAGLSGASTRLWGVEDWLAVIGTIPFIPAVVFAVYASRYGVGSHDADIPSQLYLIRASEYQTYWEVLYFISSTIIKCAIGFTCVRLDRRKRVTVIMGINMAVMVIVAILALVFVFANCTPLAATWNPALGTCQKVISLQTVSYIVSAIQMITDWTCAIIPFFIVAGLQMSQRKKVSVCAILGLGLFASIATVIRMPYLKYYDTAKYPTEIGYHLGVISITSNLECALGIIGCSLPPLRKLFKFYYGSSHDGNYKVSGGSENVLGSAGPAIKLGSLSDHDRTYHASAKRTGTRDLETDDDRDDSSHKGIIRKTDVYISTSSFHAR